MIEVVFPIVAGSTVTKMTWIKCNLVNSGGVTTTDRVKFGREICLAVRFNGSNNQKK